MGRRVIGYQVQVGRQGLNGVCWSDMGDRVYSRSEAERLEEYYTVSNLVVRTVEIAVVEKPARTPMAPLFGIW